MSQDIIGIMLSTGEELVGMKSSKEILGVSVSDSNGYCLDKIRVVAIMGTPDGRQGLGLVPWLKGNMNALGVVIKPSAVVAEFDPIQEVKAAYLQETSGIQLASSLPPSKGIIQ